MAYSQPYPQQPYQPQGYNPYQQQQFGSYSTPNQGGAAHYDAEGGAPKREMGFNDVTIRAAFVRKVFFLVAIMLGVVTIMTAIPFLDSTWNENTQTLEPGEVMKFIRYSSGGRVLYILGYVAFLIVYIVLMCCEGVRRSFPTNLICTGILTLSIGYMTMMITAYHSIGIVLMCLVITTLSCTAIILFSMQTKYDLTNCMGFLILASMFVMIFGVVAILSLIFFHSSKLYTVYAGLAALLFMFYLAVDIQMLMGGRKYEISPEDHIYAAIQIFLDIVYIFWMLLSLFGNKD